MNFHTVDLWPIWERDQFSQALPKTCAPLSRLGSQSKGHVEETELPYSLLQISVCTNHSEIPWQSSDDASSISDIYSGCGGSLPTVDPSFQLDSLKNTSRGLGSQKRSHSRPPVISRIGAVKRPGSCEREGCASEKAALSWTMSRLDLATAVKNRG